MRRMSIVSRVVAGAIIGAIIGGGAFAGWRFLGSRDVGHSEPGSADPVPSETSSTTALEVEAPWFADGVRFETTVIVPVSFFVDGGVAELVYRAETISPSLSRDDDTGQPGTPDDILVRPELWLLEIEGAAPVEATTEADAERVRFSVPETATVSDVLGLHVVGWRRAVLIGGSVTLPLDSGAEGSFHDGTTLVVATVLEQAESTIVQIEVEGPDDRWHAGGGFGYRFSDARWRLSGGVGGGGFQLTWEGDTAPTEITIVQAYAEWEPVAERTTIIAGDTP
jgi:hypothetical protein